MKLSEGLSVFVGKKVAMGNPRDLLQVYILLHRKQLTVHPMLVVWNLRFPEQPPLPIPEVWPEIQLEYAVSLCYIILRKGM